MPGIAIARELDDGDEMGYLCFAKETACVVIWELLSKRPGLVSTGLIRKAELMNAIWEFHPEYAMGYNAQEQAVNDDLRHDYGIHVNDKRELRVALNAAFCSKRRESTLTIPGIRGKI